MESIPIRLCPMLLVHDRCVVCWYQSKLVVAAVHAKLVVDIVADDILTHKYEAFLEEIELVVADLAVVVVAVPARENDILDDTVLEEITGAEEQRATQVGKEQRALALAVDRQDQEDRQDHDQDQAK